MNIIIIMIKILVYYDYDKDYSVMIISLLRGPAVACAGARPPVPGLRRDGSALR